MQRSSPEIHYFLHPHTSQTTEIILCELAAPQHPPSVHERFNLEFTVLVDNALFLSSFISKATVSVCSRIPVFCL